jgi:hypothetical protein
MHRTLSHCHPNSIASPTVCGRSLGATLLSLQRTADAALRNHAERFFTRGFEKSIRHQERLYRRVGIVAMLLDGLIDFVFEFAIFGFESTEYQSSPESKVLYLF